MIPLNLLLILLDSETKFLGVKIYDEDFLELLLRFGFNAIVATIVIYFIYYRNMKKADYTFTYFVFNTLIFFLCYLMSSVKLSMGFAFGLFAIFSILRYRTDAIPIKEMTYLFIVISIAVINAITTKKVSYLELISTNFIIVFVSFFIESIWSKKDLKVLIVEYEIIENTHTTKEKVLLQDLQKRTGLDIHYFEIISTNYLRDSAKIKVFYKDQHQN